MRLPSLRFLIGLGMVIVVGVVAGVLWLRSGQPAAPGPAAPVAITCLGGSEKSELMADPTVTRVLRERYGLTVDFQHLGSYDQVQLSTDELKARKIGCLWPSSSSAQSVFEAGHQGAFAAYRAENVLQSPEVLYAGPRGTEALVKLGLVEQRDNRYYLIDMKALLLDYVLKHRTWDSVGAEGLRGPISVSSTDPAKSNSGFTLAQLQLAIVATSDPYAAPNLAQARTALPTMRQIYDAQGLQSRTSETGFREWLTQGGEFKAPIYAGYENQVIQQIVRDSSAAGTLLKNIRVLYPDPTIYSDHPILALDADSARFIEAMKDPEVQTVAWRSYGFRSAIQLGLSNVADFPDIPLAEQIRVTPPPAADVTLALLACVKDAKTCA
ncbi:hypothetical protein AB0J90_00905 [Micromonospora sp. NPDC049523]|uniref:hypothetical protein n=1 Tax=Micromonospora sp. NPDC049523 TaxID=3155921 RepID=UPI00342EB60C